MMATVQPINLLKFRGTNSSTFTGRPQGKSVREELGLDSLDLDEETYDVLIPRGTTSINSSFFLGLFFPSVKRLGFEKFKQKYNIIIEEESLNTRKPILRNLAEGERQAYNESQGETGLL